MKKIFAITILTAGIMLSGLILNSVAAKSAKVQMLPVISEETKTQNTLWVGTFQLVWNEFMDNIVHGMVLFKDGTPETAKLLNQQEFKKSMLSENSYYTAYGKTDLELKKQIEDAIMEKFGEKSDILDKIDWNDSSNAYLVYAMLLKDFKFTTKFDMLKKEKFGKSTYKVQYFGIDKESRQNLYEGVRVLFYNNPFDFAVAMQSDIDEVILYRTNSSKSLNDIYNELEHKSKKYRGSKKFAPGDQLKVPFMSVKDSVNYKELCNNEILNTDRLYIAQALQTVDFNMDNSGVRLKSEAAMDIKVMSMPLTVKERGRNFFFNDSFVIFMKEKDKQLPYFAAKVKDMDMFKYMGEVK